MDMKNVLQDNSLYPINCLELHVREISLNDYGGWTPNIDFAKFFILNVRMLKVMRFGINCAKSNRWLVTQCRKLQLDKKVSAEAKFEFRNFSGKFTEFHGTTVKDTHDCSVADPFEASLWPSELCSGESRWVVFKFGDDVVAHKAYFWTAVGLVSLYLVLMWTMCNHLVNVHRSAT